MARRRTIRPANEAGNVEPLHTPLDRSRIEAAAVGVLQREGLANVSMRKIADELGVKAASLYYHVKDKDELHRWLAERIGAEAGLPDPSLPWREQIRLWAASFRQALNRYRDAAVIMGATIAATPARLAHIEFLFRLLTETGFGDNQIPWLASMLRNYVVGFADEESRLAEGAKKAEMNAEEWERSNRERFEALPADRYPTLIRLGALTVSPDLDREFAFGLDVLLDGFEARLKPNA
jgi:AcrR family transcriptional regulator